jgi:hypothetical protein
MEAFRKAYNYRACTVYGLFKVHTKTIQHSETKTVSKFRIIGYGT